MRFVIVAVAVLVGFSACSTKNNTWSHEGERIVEVQENAVPGTVTEVWNESQINTVRVPGQIDPSGTYYRLPHMQIIEIRPGRSQIVEFPPDNPRNDKVDKVLMPKY